MSTITVQALGDPCPIPVVKTIKAMDAMKEPGTIETHVDNETAVQNLTRLARSKDFGVTSGKLADKHFVVKIEVTALGSAQGEGEEVCCVPDARNDTVVVFDSDAMGKGDDALGKTLMKGFIYALSQLETLPKTLLFYNGGAKITVEGSLSLEDLRSLEAQGVEILTCGTCLNFYGLSEKLAVGSVTNMYTIVEKLSAASKIIKP